MWWNPGEGELSLLCRASGVMKMSCVELAPGGSQYGGFPAVEMVLHPSTQ